MTDRRFPAPWTVEKIPGGLKVCDANGQSLAMSTRAKALLMRALPGYLPRIRHAASPATSPSCRRCSVEVKIVARYVGIVSHCLSDPGLTERMKAMIRHRSSLVLIIPPKGGIGPGTVSCLTGL